MKHIILAIGIVLLCTSCEKEIINQLQPESATPITDIDGNTYQTVKIGSQIWMAENLRVRHYADGTPIEIAPTICITSNYPASYEKGGLLFERNASYPAECGLYYNWAAVVRAKNCTSTLSTPSENTQGVCPEGWRVPNKNDWKILINNLGGKAMAGGHMKTITGWEQPNVDATNNAKMNVIPAAQYILSQEMIDKEETNGFDPYGYYALFWTADEGNAWTAQSIYMGYQIAGIENLSSGKTTGICVRCLMDAQ